MKKVIDTGLKVVNTVYIQGQWLQEGEVFSVFIDDVDFGYLKSEIESHSTELFFACDNILKSTVDDIVKAIKNRYSDNTFEVYKPYVVELI